MAEGKATLSIINLVTALVILGLVLFIIIGRPGGKNPRNYQTEKNLAGELSDNNLYQAAIDEYKRILDDPDLDSVTRANISYLVGKIYFENLFDYEDAAAYYVRARTLNPQGSFYDEAGRNLISSLEKMGRMVDAKRELDKTVNIDSVYAVHKGEKAVAKIGDEPIFLSQIEKEIQDLPDEVQKQYVTREGKLEFLNQYIGLELMYRAALREGLESSPEIQRRKNKLERQLIIEKYITQNVMPEVNIDTSDIRNFYLANRSTKYKDKAYDDVKSQVFMDYQQEKARKAFSEYVAKLAAVEKVQIFEENVK
jgi:tetratricopeptide (TPR) repeat protein